MESNISLAHNANCAHIAPLELCVAFCCTHWTVSAQLLMSQVPCMSSSTDFLSKRAADKEEWEGALDEFVPSLPW